MAPTTAAAIRNVILARITRLVPRVERDVRFTLHEEQDDIFKWATRSKAACLRRVSVITGDNSPPAAVSDNQKKKVEETFLVVVAYPSGHRFRSRLGLHDVIKSDMDYLDDRVGTDGFAAYATEAPAATVISEPHYRQDGDGVVFGVLPLRVSYWRDVS